jgi:hypothetical protein
LQIEISSWSIYQCANIFLGTKINDCECKCLVEWISQLENNYQPGIPRWRKSIIFFFSVHESEIQKQKAARVCVCGIVVEPSLISDKRAQHQQKATSLSDFCLCWAPLNN